MKQLRRYFLTIIVVLAANVCHSQEKKDNTGTNPANFTYDTRFYSEMAELPNAAGSYLTNYFEFRWPLGKDLAKAASYDNDHLINNLGSKFGTRMRFRYKDLNINSPEGAFSNSNVSGIGDMDLRLLWMAYASSKMIIVPGLEATFNTASHETLGFDANVLAPTLFFVFPGLLGKGSLFAPGYQYLFDMDGGDNNKISRSQIDLYFVWLLGKGANWLIIDPQVIVDHDTDKFPALVEVEYGYMIKALPGASVYVRPGAGVGSDRPYDWNCEFGLKFIWR